MACLAVSQARSQTSEWGCVSERRRREDLGVASQAPRGVSAGGGVPFPLGEGSGEGAVPPPQKIFEFLK